MKIGIKVGTKGNPIDDLISTHPDFCEIWFLINKKGDYDNLFNKIKSMDILSGLHFWGSTSKGILANLAYPDKQNLQESINLVKQTIEVAHSNQCQYVNVHPGSCILTEVNFDQNALKFKPSGKSISWKSAQETLYNSVSILADFSKHLGIEFYIESVPKFSFGVDKFGDPDRNICINFGDLPIEIIETVLNIDNVFFTNDFGHTLANLENQTHENMWNFIYNISLKLLSKTKLLHVSFLKPPYNGTDYHGSLLEADFTKNIAIPNMDQIKQILKIYKNTDVRCLVEPISDHIGNFFALKKLIAQIV